MFGCCKYNIKFAESCERLEEETRRLSTICERRTRGRASLPR